MVFSMLRTSLLREVADWPSNWFLSPEVGTDECLIAGLNSAVGSSTSHDSSPNGVADRALPNYANFLAMRTLSARMMPSRRPSPSASRTRTVAVLDDQEG